MSRTAARRSFSFAIGLWQDTIALTRLRVFPLLVLAVLLSNSGCAQRTRAFAQAENLSIPTEAELTRTPTLTREWKERLLADHPAVRAEAADALTDAGARSLPLLRRLLGSPDENLRAEVMTIVHRLGPAAIPLLVKMLRDDRVVIRRQAIDLLVDLAPATESVQPALCAALEDEDAMVARDAARALGALSERAAPSVDALLNALSNLDADVRVYAAEALASIGPSAAPATADLVKALGDPMPAVRWAACEALAGIGPAAAPAVPRLIEALSDEFLYVRICATGALGSIGPAAASAVAPIRAAVAKDPALQNEARWALNRITGDDASSPAAVVSDVGDSNVVSDAATKPAALAQSSGNPPADWDIETGRNIAWAVELGSEAFGRPVVSDGVIYVGTDNGQKRDPSFTEQCGALAAFRASDGKFLWQDLAPRVQRGMGEFLLPSTTSAPLIETNRVYYVTAECQLRCLDMPGHVIWELDMCGTLGVFPHEASNSEVLPVGDLLIVCTSNGRNAGHTRVPSPRAPSLIAVDKRTGSVVWRAIGAGEAILHGQWSSPISADVNGSTQVLFGGGDGILRAYDASSGREIWRFDGNPKDSRYLPHPGVFSRSPIVASPVFDAGRVFLAMGDDPSHGNGPSLLHAIGVDGQGDVTESRRLWTSREIGRVVGPPIVRDGLLYIADLGGRVSCLDSATGALIWKYETGGAIWGCLLFAGEKLYAGNVDGVMTVLRAGRRLELLAKIEMDSAIYSRPALDGDALYLATARRLYRISVR